MTAVPPCVVPAVPAPRLSEVSQKESLAASESGWSLGASPHHRGTENTEVTWRSRGPCADSVLVNRRTSAALFFGTGASVRLD